MNEPVNSSSTERVSLDQVLRVAELAQLALTLDEQAEMLRDLNSILGQVEQLNELDTADVPAMAQVGEMLSTSGPAQPTSQNRAVGHPDEHHGGALRSDAPRASLDRGVVMAEAPETDGVYFKVPKVIER